jgi:hypothetical protein
MKILLAFVSRCDTLCGMEDPTDKERGESHEPEAAADAEGEGGTEGGFRERGRKERVLHTRISEQLAEDIRRAADDLRVPVSNLVRNVLEETFSVVESVTDSLGTWLEDVATETGQPHRHRSHRHRRRRWARHWARGRDGEASPSMAAPEEPAWENSWEESPAACPEAQPGEKAAPNGVAMAGEVPAEPAAPSQPVHRPDFPEVLGWQPLVMNRRQACADCGRLLVRGDRAHLGLTQGGVSGLVLCRACMDARE